MTSLKHFIFRHFQIGFDTNQFSETADMADLISDILEIRNSKKEDISIQDSALLISLMKKNSLITKVFMTPRSHTSYIKQQNQ